MKLPEISQDAKDWLKIFAVLAVCVALCGVFQSMDRPSKTLHVDVQILPYSSENQYR